MSLDRGQLVQDSRRINIQLEQLANRTLAAADVTGAQAQALLYILEQAEAGASVTALHRFTNHSKATISCLIKRLREKGYVRVDPCREDDRRKLLFGTEKGEEVREFLDRSLLCIQDQLYRGFTPRELTTLDRLQKRMLWNLSVLTQPDCKEESKS